MAKPAALLSALLLAALLTLLASSSVLANSAPTVSTDKDDYGPLETVQISGAGFDTNAGLSVLVTAPDGTIRSADGSGSLGPDAVTVDGAGAFTLAYELSGTDASGNV